MSDDENTEAEVDRNAPKPLSLKMGTDYKLEEDADRWLAESRRGVTSMSAKTDYLSKEQLALRQSKEVLNHHGVSDAALFSGMYRRAFNPLYGQRPKSRRNSDDG